MKRYGLLGSATSLTKGRVGGKGAPPPRASAFGGGESSSDSEGGEKEDPLSRKAVNRRLLEEQSKREGRVEKSQVEALTEDPSVYDYDGVYDSLGSRGYSSAMTGSSSSKGEKKGASRYISSLMQQAKLREVDRDRVYERKLAKERAEAEKEHGKAGMQFVTSAYKKKLIEQKKWELQEKLEEETEEREEELKRNEGMTGFYSKLLTKNIAMGGSVEHAKSAFTSGSKRHESTSMLGREEVALSDGDSGGLRKAHRGAVTTTDTSLGHADGSTRGEGDNNRHSVNKRARESEGLASNQVDLATGTRQPEDQDAAKHRRDEMVAAAKKRALERKMQISVAK